MLHSADKKPTVQGCNQGRINTNDPNPSQLVFPCFQQRYPWTHLLPRSNNLQASNVQGELHWRLRDYDFPALVCSSHAGVSMPWLADSALAQSCRSIQYGLIWDPEWRKVYHQMASLSLKKWDSNQKNQFYASGPAVAVFTELNTSPLKLAYKIYSSARCPNNGQQSETTASDNKLHVQINK